ncbi:MAG: protein kinase [Thermoguttaceae bacterium]|nr:protein kinase [Thermoguttaceae bacterium]
MSSDSDIHKTPSTQPIILGSENKEADQVSALTVGLSDSATLILSNEKASSSTTEPIASDVITPSTSTAMSPDATVIRNRNERQEEAGARSSGSGASSTDSSSSENVKIISDSLIDSHDSPTFKLGDYQIIDAIGGGGMGRIYRAWDTRLDRDVALKVLAPNQQSEEFKERFIVEAKASAKLHHENIVSVYSFEQTDGITYLVMEYIPGKNVRDIVTQNGPLSIEDALSYAIQMSSALEHINEKGIVHRDIKPSNVLITPDGTVKVIDLGLAKCKSDSQGELTQLGATLGTFDYISPEQALDSRNVDIRSDIYSLGCSLFFMLTGQPPYPEGTGLQKLLRHQGIAPPNVQDFRSDVPDRFAEIIMRCMSKVADKRFQTPQALSKALFIAAEELGMRPSGISLAKWYMPSISRLRVWKDRLSWAVPIVLLLFIIMVLDYIWKPNPQQAEFFPEKPGLKRSSASEDSEGRAVSKIGLPVMKAKPLALEFNSSSFPQPPEELLSTQDEPGRQDFNPGEPGVSVSDNASSGDQPALPTPGAASTVQPTREPVTPAATTQERNVPQTPGGSTQKNTIHSVRLETD